MPAARGIHALSIVLLAAAACSGDSDRERAIRAASSVQALQTEAAAAAPAPLTKYIANTGGAGVRIRAECADAAAGTSAWAEGTAVEVGPNAEAACQGWSLASTGEVQSWVRDDYLSDATPAGAPAAPVVRAQPPGAAPAPPAQFIPAPPPPPPAAPPLGPPPLAFTTTSGAVLTLDQLDNKAALYGGPSGFTYLGHISRSRSDVLSICNPDGPHGGRSARDSVRNPDSAYGAARTDASFSAYNAQATAPPRIILGTSTVGHLTRSKSYGQGSLDPDVLLASLAC
jgi:hypothetical protein